VDSFTVHVNVTDNRHPQAVRILEVDSALVAHPDNLWPPELPGVDGILLCYDASNEDSFTRIPELLGM
jgi:GTPase SAR1 family protein